MENAVTVPQISFMDMWFWTNIAISIGCILAIIFILVLSYRVHYGAGLKSSEEIEILRMKRTTAPYYWPDSETAMRQFLSAAIVGLVFYILDALLVNKIKLEQESRDLVMVLLGVVLSCFKDVYGFTFGSSADSRKKSETISQSLDTKDKIIETNVKATAALAAGAGPTLDALKAAEVVAPGAAAAAAPPAAETAAPPAAREAVDDFMRERDEAGEQKP